MSDDDEESTSGSQSTLFGSVKSSKSSASFFGSCKSTDTIGSFHTAYSTSNQSNATGGGRSGATFFGSCKSTDTIGSFHTARSISLSTLYFSAKNYGWGWNDDEDTKTLNWTMNHQSFDELSDTSTLVGDGDMDRAEEDLTPQPVILEENVENEGDTVESSSTTESLELVERISMEHLSVFENHNIIKTNTEISVPNMNQPIRLNPSSTTQSKEKCFTYYLKKLLKMNREDVLTLMLIMAVSLSSVLIHLTVNQQKISHWNLIFWKACIQVVFSLPFLCQNRQRHPLNFSQKSVPMISGIFVFSSLMTWCFSSDYNIITSQLSSLMYLSTPLIIIIQESIIWCNGYSITFPIRGGLVIILMILWSLGCFCYSIQFWPSHQGLESHNDNNSLWQLKMADPLFVWSVLMPNSSNDLSTIGFQSWFFSIMAVLSMSGALTSLKFGHPVQWPSFLFWHGMAGLLTSLCGLIYNGSWPIWSLDSWWIPLLTALFGTLGNVLIVKMVLQQQQYSSFVIYIKVSLEVIALFILSNDNIERSPSNMASLGLFITCCIIVILYGRKV